MAPIDKVVGFCGAGAMAEALAKGFLAKGVVEAAKIICSDVADVRCKVFEAFGATSVATNLEVVKQADVVFLCTKPQYVTAVLDEARNEIDAGKTIVSIAAGVTLEQMENVVGADKRLVRVMPNTPCLVGEAAAAMALGGQATQEDADIVATLMGSVGRILHVQEKLLSAVTGVSGSGPAYIFMVIEAMADGGVKAGLPRDIAMELAAQTVMGAAKMVLGTGKHPGALKDMVTSPAGTTIAAYHELEKAGVRNAFINAVEAAAKRADELSKL